jgi:hypothetical protein
MDKLWKIVSVTVALAALVVVLFQRVTIGRLEERLEAAEARRPGKTPDDPRAARLERRVAWLEQTVARVVRMSLAGGRGRAEGPAAGPAPASGAGSPAATSDRVSRLREDVDALLTGEALATEQGRKRLHQVVRDAQDQVWRERRQRWRKVHSELRKERMKEFAEKAGLSASQQQQLTSLLDGERSRRRQLMRSARDGEVPFTQAMKTIRGLRTETDQKVKGLLDSKQYEQYEKLRSERRRWR